MIEKKILDNVSALIDQGNTLKIGNEHKQVKSEDHLQQCYAWIASASHTMELIFPNKKATYRDRFLKLISRDQGYVTQNQVGACTGLMEYVKKDIENGLLVSFIDSIRAEVFDDFINHSEEYLKNGLKNEAGVIAGVVFEDSIRRLSTKHSIPEAGEKLDQLISELSKKAVISSVKAKRFRVAAHVRTKATHAQWNEFDTADVKETIRLSRDLAENYLNVAV